MFNTVRLALAGSSSGLRVGTKLGTLRWFVPYPRHRVEECGRVRIDGGERKSGSKVSRSDPGQLVATPGAPS